MKSTAGGIETDVSKISLNGYYVIAVVATFWGDSIDEWLGWSPGTDDGFLVVAIVLVVSTLAALYMWWHKRRMHHGMDKSSTDSRDSDGRH